MGGPPTPSIGFGIGIERMLIALEAELGDAARNSAPRLDAFVIDGVGDGSATVLVAELRAAGLRADRAYGGRSWKAQMKLADRSGARFAVILGRDEAEHDAVAVKDLESGEQRELPRRELAGWLQSQVEDVHGSRPGRTGPHR
jgi:histidyl-tRNA synthetase